MSSVHIHRSWPLLPLLFGLLCGHGQAAQTPSPSADTSIRRLNVLFIAVDDLRPELGCYGKTTVQSPHIDQLAARGLLFERAYCQFSHCSPSRKSLMTGVRPNTALVGPHLPEYFKSQGYHCETMGKVYHGSFEKRAGGANENNPASWSVPAWYPSPRYYYTDEGVKEARRVFEKKAAARGISADTWTNYFVQGYATEAPDVADDIPYDGQIATRAVQKLRELKDKPFFLAVGFIKPHLPFVAPRKYWDLYDREQIQMPDNMYAQKNAPAFALLRRFELAQYTDTSRIDDDGGDTARRLIHGYRACVSYVDAQIGRVLDELDRLGLREKTVVVLWGDHGWKLGEHNAWSKFSTCENDTRVPLILAAPGKTVAGQKTRALVELVDLYPTLCELCGLTKPAHLEGTSLAPLLQTPDRPWKKAAFSIMTRTWKGEDNDPFDGMAFSIRTDRYRLTAWVSRKDKKRVPDLAEALRAGSLAAVELYDHEKDPGENENIAGHVENKPVVDTLLKQLAAGWEAAAPL